MKLNGIFGKGTGKLGSSVFAVSGGEQIMREYNPNVSNPNTDAQVAQRAKLKLMSQLAAALAPILLFQKSGLVSARNQFVSQNIGLATYSDLQAAVELTKLSITSGTRSIGSIEAATDENDRLKVNLLDAAPAAIKRVVYGVFRKTDAAQLEFVEVHVVSEPGVGRTFTDVFSLVSGQYVVYAYGLTDADAKATIKYNDYMAEHDTTEAILGVQAMVKAGASSATKTMAAEWEL